MKTKDELLQIKEDIDDAKTRQSELEGKQQLLMEELQEEWGCKTLEEANKKIEEMGSDFDNISVKIRKGIKKLEDTYDV